LNNAARYGGALYGATSVTTSTFGGNTALSDGGAIYGASPGAATLTLVNSTLP
jgi:predicted outer membrane repeat protein